MSRKHRPSRVQLTKQLATKRDLQRLRDDILRAIVHAQSGLVEYPTIGYVRPFDPVDIERIDRAVNG